MSGSATEISLRVPLEDIGALKLDRAWGQEAKEYLARARVLLAGQHAEGASGRVVVKNYTRVMDHVVATLFEAARDEYRQRYSTVDQRCSLLAQGGYGRGELNPCSDVDLLVLYPYRRDAYVETVTERVLYALWDTGVEVGHATRSLRYCVKLAAEDFKVKTALLDARYVAGDEALYSQFAAAVEKEVLKRNSARFLRQKIADTAARHRRYGDSVFLVEPHVKEGEGGLRDLHTAMWLARVKFKTKGLVELVQKGLLTEREQTEIEEARDFLWRVRNGLHFLSGEHQDQLTFEYQEKIAAELGFEDQGGFRAVELFMRQYYLCAATLNRFSEEMGDRCVERPRPYNLLRRLGGHAVRRGVRIAGQEVVVGNPAIFREDPAMLVRVFTDAQRFCLPISGATRRLIREHVRLIDDTVRRSEQATRAFFDILGWKTGIYDALQEMHKLGILGALIPEFGKLLCMAQYELYHVYTVDEHSLRGVLALDRLRLGEYKDTAPSQTEVIREIDRIEILYLGMLLHDIGKGQGGDHSNRGAAMIHTIGERLQLNADDLYQLEFLVREHLLMSHLATRRDICDEKLLVEFARTVGTLDNLKKLYLLTYADMRAVNPKAWSSWHEQLLGNLYRSTVGVFERGVMAEQDQTARVERIKARVGKSIGLAGGASLDGFLIDMPDRYFLSTPESDISRHFELGRLFEEEPLVTRVTHFPEREYSEFTVLTRDRPGLFAKLTGVLTAHGMNIVGARITTSHSRTALDVFRVSHANNPDIARSEDRWERIYGAVADVLVGRMDVEALVEQAQRPSVLGERVLPRVGTKIEFDNEISEDFTVLDVFTQDRGGVLFAVTNVLYRLGVSIHLAKITTNLDQVLDVFYVTDAKGEKIKAEPALERIRAGVLAALQAIDEARSAGA